MEQEKMKTQKKLAYEMQTANKTKTATNQEQPQPLQQKQTTKQNTTKLLSTKSGTATSSPVKGTASRIFEYLSKELGQLVKRQKLDFVNSEALIDMMTRKLMS